jgi:hypothetical protein
VSTPPRLTEKFVSRTPPSLRAQEDRAMSTPPLGTAQTTRQARSLR